MHCHASALDYLKEFVETSTADRACFAALAPDAFATRNFAPSKVGCQSISAETGPTGAQGKKQPRLNGAGTTTGSPFGATKNGRQNLRRAATGTPQSPTPPPPRPRRFPSKGPPRSRNVLYDFVRGEYCGNNLAGADENQHHNGPPGCGSKPRKPPVNINFLVASECSSTQNGIAIGYAP